MKYFNNKFVKFFITGLTGFMIDLIVLSIISTLFFQGKNFSVLGIISLPKFISSLVALIFVFFVNRSWVFKSDSQKIHKQAIKFIIVCIFNVFLSSILYNIFYLILEPIIINEFNLSNSILIIFSSITTEALKMISSFFLYKKIVFKQ